MAYTPDNLTDKELEALEKRIAEVYKQAEKDLTKEVNDYFAKFKLRDKEMQKLVQTGDMTQSEYQQWRLTQMGRGQRFEALRDKVAERYTKANEVANAYINDITPSIYSLNRNYEAYVIEKTVGSCDFTLWDESTVRRLLVEQPDIMPYYPKKRALDRGIDLAYGKTQITNHVTSGILRGLSPGKIANELMSSVTDMNRTSAVRAARTGITAAQNAGRMDSYKAAEKMGIKIKRRWVGTKDARTRLAHGLADGQIVEGTEKPFKVGGELLMFPGDTSMGAHGWNIYNCRCTTRTVEKDGIEAEPRQMRVKDPVTGEDVLVNEMTYTEWKQWKETGTKPEPPKPAPKKSAFTPAKTRTEAEEYAKRFADSVSYAGATDLDTVNEINRTLTELQSRYPTNKLSRISTNSKLTRAEAQANFKELDIGTKWVNNIKTFDSGDWAERVARNREKIAQYMPFTDPKQYPKDTVKTYKKFIKQLEEECKYTRWTTTTRSVYGTITHEYGHILADQYFGQINTRHANGNFDHARENPLWLQKLYVSDVFQTAKKNGDIYKISMYGATNEYEFFAETFTMHVLGETLPDYIENMMKKVLNDGIL